MITEHVIGEKCARDGFDETELAAAALVDNIQGSA
jgi:hypothetical protein